MTVTRQSAYATTAWTLPLFVWIASSLLAEATVAGGAARASARIGPVLPIAQLFALALLVPAIAWRQNWRRSVGIAALIVVAPWPVATLMAQTGGVSFFGLGVGQFIVWLWALAVISTTRLMAMGDFGTAVRLPITQAVLVVVALALARATAPIFAGMVAM